MPPWTLVACIAFLWVPGASLMTAAAQDSPSTAPTPSDESSASAGEDRKSEEEAELAWANLDPRNEGAALLSLHGELAIFDPSAFGAQKRTLAGGASVQIMARGKNWPLLVGLGAGATWIDGNSRPGPTFAGTEPGGGFYVGSTTVTSSAQLRHVELLVRLEPPWWRWVRPYAQGAFGLISVWQSSALRDDEGTALLTDEKQRDLSYLSGFELGLDIKAMELSQDTIYRSDLLLTLGFQRWYSGPIDALLFRSAGAEDVQTASASARIRLWQPFLALTVRMSSKPRPKVQR